MPIRIQTKTKGFLVPPMLNETNCTYMRTYAHPGSPNAK